MRTAIYVVLLFLVSTTGTVLAENCKPPSTTIGVWTNLHSYHISRTNKVNEHNELLGLQWNRWFAGVFNNSFYQQSYILGWCWLRADVALGPQSPWRLTAKLSPGIAYGYGNRFLLSFWNLTPGLLPSAGINLDINDNLLAGVETFYVWTEQGGVLVTGLNIGWRF